MALVAASGLLEDVNPIWETDRRKWVIDLSRIPLEVLAPKVDWILTRYSRISHPDLWFDGQWTDQPKEDECTQKK